MSYTLQGITTNYHTTTQSFSPVDKEARKPPSNNLHINQGVCVYLNDIPLTYDEKPGAGRTSLPFSKRLHKDFNLKAFNLFIDLEQKHMNMAFNLSRIVIELHRIWYFYGNITIWMTHLQ